MLRKHETINYVEFPSKNLEATKTFFQKVFNWSFTDYGDEYISFSDQGIGGGFFKSNLSNNTANGSALIILYSNDLDQTESKIKAANGKIVKPIFSFPGGHRFNFTDPNGNEYAVWSDCYK